MPGSNTAPAHTPASSTPGRAGRHLTINDVCTELGISRSTFYDWRAKGRAPRCIKLPNGDLRIRRVVFEAWLTDHEENA